MPLTSKLKTEPKTEEIEAKQEVLEVVSSPGDVSMGSVGMRESNESSGGHMSIDTVASGYADDFEAKDVLDMPPKDEPKDEPGDDDMEPLKWDEEEYHEVVHGWEKKDFKLLI